MELHLFPCDVLVEAPIFFYFLYSGYSVLDLHALSLESNEDIQAITLVQEPFDIILKV